MEYFEIPSTCGRNLLSRLADKGPLSEEMAQLNMGVDVNSKDHNGRTPLFHAADYRQYRISRYLLKKGADADVRDLAERTPLSFAAQSDCEYIVQLLLDTGTDINSTYNDGRTPLSYAAEAGNPKMIEVLFKNEADRTIRDCEGGGAFLDGINISVKNTEDVVALFKEEFFQKDERAELTELEKEFFDEN
jgi:ankyrin repeat protein